MVLVPCYRCNRYHRIVPLGNMLSHHKGIVLKSSRPSLPLKKAPPFSPRPSSMVFTPPSVPPFAGDRNLRSEGGNRPTRCSEPLRSKVGGPSKVFAMLCGMGPPYYSSLIRTALLQLADWGGMATICYSLMIGGAWGTNC